MSLPTPGSTAASWTEPHGQSLMDSVGIMICETSAEAVAQTAPFITFSVRMDILRSI